MTGRHRKLTPERTEALLEALRQGMTRRAAAGTVDIHPATFYRMLDADATFRDAVEKAEAVAEGRYIAVVAEAAPKNWQAAAWWLERRRHEDFARRDKVDMTVDLRKEAERVAAELGLDDVDGLVAEADRIVRGG